MTLHMQNILQHLFQADTLGDVPRERLEAMVEEYPSFGIARYLLSSKLRAEQAGNFEEETRKTNLYFTNPLWLQWMLQGESPVAAMEERSTGQAVTEHWIEEPLPEYAAQDQWKEQEDQPVPDIVTEEPATPAPWEEPVAEPVVIPQETPQPVEEPVAEAQAAPEPIAEPSKPKIPESGSRIIEAAAGLRVLSHDRLLRFAGHQVGAERKSRRQAGQTTEEFYRMAESNETAPAKRDGDGFRYRRGK